MCAPAMMTSLVARAGRTSRDPSYGSARMDRKRERKGKGGGESLSLSLCELEKGGKGSQRLPEGKIRC